MDLTTYQEMDEEQLAALPGRIKRAIVAAITGRWVPVWCSDVYNPVVVGERMKMADAAPASAPLPAAGAGQRGGLRG